MNLKKFEKKLAKLNSVFSALSDDGKINEIEKDLLKSYVVKLYQSLNKLEADQVVIPHDVEKEMERVQEVVIEPKPQKVVAEAPAQEEKVAEEPESVFEENEDVEIVDEAMENLFADFSSSELGDKLSNSAISDLTKAWSINEKIFTIKELFAGDSENFRETIRALNDMSSFDDAKKHLMTGVANQNNWSEGEKFKKARSFIKLVKRRYN